MSDPTATAITPAAGKRGTCPRCGEERPLEDVPPLLPWPTGEQVCEPCTLDLLDVSMGRPPRSGLEDHQPDTATGQ